MPQQRAALTPGHCLGWPRVLAVTASTFETLTTCHRWVPAAILTLQLLGGEPGGHGSGVEAVKNLVHPGPVLAVVQKLVAVAQLVIEDVNVSFKAFLLRHWP